MAIFTQMTAKTKTLTPDLANRGGEQAVGEVRQREGEGEEVERVVSSYSLSSSFNTNFLVTKLCLFNENL
jgi:hypothetical protein